MSIRSLVATQSYSWHQVLEAEGKRYLEHLNDVFARVAASGIEGWEGSIASKDEADTIGRLLKKHGLRTQSIYANSTLHTGDWRTSVDDVLRQARLARPLGVRVVVTNPNPIRWGGPENKSDEQLRTQAAALQAMGEALSREGMKLGYHVHAPEMRASAREFHHMMLATDPAAVGLCFDAHWIYRGAENSQVAMEDILKLYGDRIASLHVRQSRGGVWIETLDSGDVDYNPIVAALHTRGSFDGPIVMEIAREPGTAITMSAVEAHRQGRNWVREVFGV
jgi:inosose dehydratase